MWLICNDWRQILRPETPPKFILKTFCYKNEGTRKIFYLLHNKHNAFIIQPSNVKYNKPLNLCIYIYIYIYIYINTAIMAEYTPSKNVSTTAFFNLFSLTHWETCGNKICLYLYLSIYLYICWSIYLSIYIYIYIYIFVYIYMCVCVCVCVYVYVCVCLCLCLCVYVCVCVCVCIHLMYMFI